MLEPGALNSNLKTCYEPLSKLLVSPLITPIVVPYIILYNPPSRSLDYSSYRPEVGTLNPKPKL